MLDINSFTTSIKNQVLGWLSSIGTNLICPLIAAAAAIYCIFQLSRPPCSVTRAVYNDGRATVHSADHAGVGG